MIKFMHCADLHLDSPFKGLRSLPSAVFKRLQESTFVSFKRLMNAAIREKVDFIIIAGDLYDGENRSLKAQAAIKKECERAELHGIFIYIIHGNHDHLSGQWVDLDWPKNVYFFKGGEPESMPFIKNGRTAAVIHGYSYEKREVLENRVSMFSNPSGDGYHIGLLHGQAEGQGGHHPYAPFALQDLLQKGYDYWALGHIHKRMDISAEPPVCYSGNIQGRHKGETGSKGAYIVTLKDKIAQRTFIESCDILWLEEEVDLSGIESHQDVLNICLKIKEQTRRQNQGVLLRLVLTGSTVLYTDLLDGIFQEEMNELLCEGETDGSFVYVYESLNHTVPLQNIGELGEGSYFLKDVLENMRSDRQVDEILSGLYLHKHARKYVEPLSELEKKEIMKQAENVLFAEFFKR